ncbi:MAG: hypothetical protein KKI08_18430 [Armatimonadetes bacterium]|nr:hypothetical protein [Armatimonadota bacterium]
MAAYLRGAHSLRSRRIYQESRAAMWRQYALECRAAGETQAAHQAAGQARRALNVCAAMAYRK